MKYIVYEYSTNVLGFNGEYQRVELKNDKELNDYLFRHQDNLRNIEIFSKSNKCKVEFNVIIE